MEMLTIDPHVIDHKDLHQFILGSVAPRPIAFVSTLDENGVDNLAPYSFFNAFSSNPPIVVFSSNRRGSNNTTKDTLENIRLSGECVINSVNYAMVRQMAIASVEFPKEVSEFAKTGLTPIPSDLVAPPRVAESPSQMECKVKDIITLGDKGGAGHLIICEIVRMHISKDVLGERNRIDPHKMDLMGRMGRAYYVRCSGEAIHTIVQDYLPITIGYDNLPSDIKQSPVLTGNDLGKLAGMIHFPEREEINAVMELPEVNAVLRQSNPKIALHYLAKTFLDRDEVATGFSILMHDHFN
ncbi:MAG TPA: flavin reductase family protein [Saprospiraceae bacterium]|nr:flavin reductase family protein [Saprospiraceae bacterium]